MSGPPHNARCPRCGQRAPIVLRGLEATCTACGGRRLPFTAKSLNLAGKGSRIGGAAARFFGWASILGGVSLAAFIGLLVQSLWPAGLLGYAFAIPILLISLAIGITLLVGGSRLGRHGAQREKSTQLEAIRSMAAHNRGVLTARQVARTLSLPEEQADAMLTELAKRPDERVSLDVDDDGNLFYLFGLDSEQLSEARWRIANPELDAAVVAEAEAEAEAARLEAAARARRQIR